MNANPRTAGQEIDALIEAAPAAARPLLRAIRKLALAIPGATERISYRMPTVFVNGRVLLHYGAFSDHVGIYPPPKGDAAFMKAIAPYAGPKGNLSFPYGTKVPQALLKAILGARLAQIGPAQAPAKKKAGDPLTPKKAPARRPRHPMPAFVKRALEESGLMPAYRERPPYQQNDYVGWIAGAKTPATREKRLAQMLDELKRGGVYMRMKHPASARAKRG